MAKASLKLSNGTLVTIEGTPEEVHKVLSLHGGGEQKSSSGHRPIKTKKTESKSAKAPDRGSDDIDLPEIVNLVKNCDEAEEIEKRILDRASQVVRTLLPLYVVHEYLENVQGLTSGEIAKVTTDLGIPVQQPNASRTLSGTASKYVIGHTVRKKGFAVRYKLSRRGVQYLKGVITGKSNA